MKLFDIDNLPLGRKIVAVALMASGISLALVAGVFIIRERLTAPQRLTENLQTMAAVIGDNAVAALTFNDAKTAESVLGTLKASPAIRMAVLYNAKGELVARFDGGGDKERKIPRVSREGVEIKDGRVLLFREIVSGQDGVGTLYLESDMSEMEQRLWTYVWTTFLLLLLALVLSYWLAEKFQARVSQPLRDVVLRMKDIATGEGDLTKRLVVANRDEVGEIASAFNTFADKIQDLVKSLQSTLLALGDSSRKLSMTSTSMSANAQETNSQATVVSVGAEQVSRNLQTVATATQEMTASIREIASNANQAAQVASSAVRVALDTNQTVANLGKSGAEIGQVIKVITSIAEQTNLLALNATIEAARAGDAGKGFAVVANEIKELAKETARSTDDISRKIEGIQGNTRTAVDAIGKIAGVINQVNDIANTIATAVEEQTATTNEIGRNLSEAARGSAEIASNIAGMAQATHETSKSAAEIQTASQDLDRLSQNLGRTVAPFRA